MQFKTTDESEEEEEEKNEETGMVQKFLNNFCLLFIINITLQTDAILFTFWLRKPMKLRVRIPSFGNLSKATVLKYMKREDRKLLDHVPGGSFACLNSWTNGTSIYGYQFKKQFACGETTSRLHRHDLPPIVDDDARAFRISTVIIVSW